jgi:hypothetical protein
MYRKFSSGNLKARNYLEDLDINGDNIEMDLKGVRCECVGLM